MATAFQNQACQMNLELGRIKIPVSLLQVFDSLSILLLIPVFDLVVYPYFKKIGKPLSLLFKIGLGFSFAALSMIAATVVEVYRKKYSPADVLYINANQNDLDSVSACQNIDNYNPYYYQLWAANQQQYEQPGQCQQVCDTTTEENGVNYIALQCISCSPLPLISNLSVFAQIPQFVLIGISEILSSITSLDFFYSQSPLKLRSIVQSLNLATTALGAWVVIPLVLIVNANKSKPWITTNLDDGHLDDYFILLAILMLSNNIVFIYISRNYKYNNFSDDEQSPGLDK